MRCRPLDFRAGERFEEVIGIDFSQAFVDAGNRMKKTGQHVATRLDEGSATTRLDLSVGADVDRSRVFFEQGALKRFGKISAVSIW